ncbi:MAG: twin-arginine translocase TatA/TatE family subunit [Anaerolineales bacterium]
MDWIGLGGSEILVLLFLAGVLLGPRRLARLTRDIGSLLGQIRARTRDLTQELNREIDLLETTERKSTEAGKSSEAQANDATDSENNLPEAYRSFREDFPDEGKLEDLAKKHSHRNGRPGQPNQPKRTQSTAQSDDSLDGLTS